MSKKMRKVTKKFFEGNTLDVAKRLLGKILVHKLNHEEIAGKIVEVEAYIGDIDKAAHSYNNRKTERTKVMFGPPGYAYVYLIYGMYYCMNVVTGEEGKGEAVLIRALEPVCGIEQMALNRYARPIHTFTKQQRINLTNGPGKLCRALGITKENYGDDLTGSRLYICESDKYENFDMGVSKRINIDYAEEAKDFEWRFFIKGNPYVSR